MKILQLVQKPQRRGAEVFAFQLSQELCRQGHDVRTVYLYPYQGAGCLPLQAEDWVLSGREGHRFEKFPGFHPQLLQTLKQVIQQFQPDVVQVNGARTVKYGAFSRYFHHNQPWVLIYRNIGQPQDWVHGWHYHFFYHKLVMPRINGVIGVSQATLHTLTDFYALAVPTAHIPNGVEVTSLTPTLSREAMRRSTQIPLDAPLLLFVGSLTPEKRLDRLLRLVEHVRVQIPELYLWVVGDGPLRPELERQVEALGLADIVRFWGVQADVATYMQAADLFLLTSDTEGIPAVVLEAGWLRLPVVATRVGGLAECVLNGETGILVDSQDEVALAQAVLKLLQHPQQRVAMGERAHQWIQANFTMDIIAQRYFDFYQQVLTRAHPATT